MSIALKYPKSPWSFNPIPNGCVLYLPLWRPDLRGSVFKSIDPYGHTATVTGATKVALGRDFDGSDDLINLGKPAVFTGMSALTVGFWFYRATAFSGTSYVINNDSDTDRRSYALGLTPTNAYGWVVNSSGTLEDVSAALTYAGSWHFVVMTYDGAGLELYADGSKISPGTDSLTGTVRANTTDSFELMRSSRTSTYFSGSVGEVIIYNRALTLQEIQYIYNLTKGRYI